MVDSKGHTKESSNPSNMTYDLCVLGEKMKLLLVPALSPINKDNEAYPAGYVQDEFQHSVCYMNRRCCHTLKRQECLPP